MMWAVAFIYYFMIFFYSDNLKIKKLENKIKSLSEKRKEI